MTHGMIVAPQPEAVEAGAVALRGGGNIVDAAIACAFVQGVVDPQMTGIAGFGSMQLYLPGRGVHTFLDFHGTVPAAATPEMWVDLIEGETRDGFGFILEGRVNEAGYQSITVPGSLKAYHEAHTSYGAMAWADVLAPAIAYAEEGFTVRPHVYDEWIDQDAAAGRVDMVDRLRLTETGRRIYFREDGTLKRPGDIVRNPDMARTLRRIAEAGADIFYTGEIAQAIDADMRLHGGLISAQDLADYRTTRNEPLWGEYRGHRIATNQPPGGGVMLIEMLNILESFDLASLGHNAPEYIRVVAEAMKLATIDKDAHVGDPKFREVPLDRLCDKGYAAALAGRIERGEKAHVERMEGATESPNTTHVSVVDREGNAVAMTHSLGSSSGAITEGLGFMYNNCMGVFDPRPGRTGSLEPGKSRFTAMCPSLVFDEGGLMLNLGAPGGTNITMGVLQAILNVIDFGMSMSDAVSVPRFSATSDAIGVSNRVPRYVTAALEAEGYEVASNHESYAFARVHGIRVDGGRWTGGADPAADGMALEV